MDRTAGGHPPDRRRLAGAYFCFSYPEFVDWPATLRTSSSGGIGFVVQVSDGRQVIAETTLRPLAAGTTANAPDSNAWRGIFAEATTVRAFDAPDEKLMTAPPVQTYPAGQVLSLVRSAYCDTLAYELGVAAGPPTLAAFAVQRAPLSAPAGGRSDGDAAVEQFVRFLRSSEKTGKRLPTTRADPCADFHQIVAAMGTHPRLMRRLGLVLDIELPAGKLGLDSPSRDLRIRVVPADFDFDNTRHFCHWTAVEYDTAASDGFRVFTASRRSDPGRGGFYLLGGEQTSIAQEKLEHATLALIQHRREVFAKRGPLPALLQGGMRLNHAGLPGTIGAAMAEQSRLERALGQRKQMIAAGIIDCPPEEEPLYAEQVTRGYRIDVRDVDNGRWRSLCRRQSRYRSGTWSWPAADSSLEEEGMIEPAVYIDDHAEQSALRATQDLFEWDGWSLVVPRPDHSAENNEARADRCAPDVEPPLTAQFEVPAGSLQPQRFGRCYQFRARTVDLAGNSLSVDEADAIAPALPIPGLATPPVCCLRVESAKPPVIFRAQRRGPGEAGDIIVLRDAESPRYRTDEFRVHVLPPEVPLRIAEKHGVFDNMSAADSWRLIRDHRGELAFEAAKAEKKTEKIRTIQEPATAKEIYTPYLPDPMVRQAVLILPDGAGRVDMPPFDDIPRRMKRREQPHRSAGQK